MTAITVRRMESADLPEVLSVLRSALGEPPGLERTKDLWNWKHVANPFGESIVLLAEIAGRIAGVRAFMRWELRTPEGGALRGVRAVDTATHPDFHRRGIFQTLTMAALEEAESDGVDLVFNTPNARSRAGYLKMGWSEVGGIRVMASPSWRLFRSADDEPVVDAPSGAPEMPIADRVPLGYRTPRTKEYLAWRFGSHPTACYRSVAVDGSVAVVRENTRFGRPELVVSDLFGPRPEKALRETRRGARAAYLVGSFRRGSPERRAALRSGLVPIPRVQAMLLVARPLTDLGRVDDLALWDLTLGDLELL